jgi:hypothetical protein
MTPYLLSFAFICVAFSLGLQKRQRWMWYAGWLVFLLVAVSIVQLLVFVLSKSQTASSAIFGCTCIAGILLFWTSIALWWKNRRGDFRVPQSPSKK